MCTSPAQSYKMPGHMGNKQVTTQSLKMVSVRPDENIMIVKDNSGVKEV